MDIIIITLTKNELHKKVYIKIYFKQEGFTGFSLSDQNLGIQMLGSYPVEAKVISKTSNSAIVEYSIDNVLGWDSATRFVRNPDRSTSGIISDKERGTGLNLGGNFYNEYIWEEEIIYK